MDKQNLMPNQAQPVNRNTTGQLPSEAELSEEVLEQQGSNAFGASAHLQPSWRYWDLHPVDLWPIGREAKGRTSYDGDGF